LRALSDPERFATTPPTEERAESASIPGSWVFDKPQPVTRTAT